MAARRAAGSLVRHCLASTPACMHLFRFRCGRLGAAAAPVSLAERGQWGLADVRSLGHP